MLISNPTSLLAPPIPNPVAYAGITCVLTEPRSTAAARTKNEHNPHKIHQNLQPHHHSPYDHMLLFPQGSEESVPDLDDAATADEDDVEFRLASMASRRAKPSRRHR